MVQVLRRIRERLVKTLFELRVQEESFPVTFRALTTTLQRMRTTMKINEALDGY